MNGDFRFARLALPVGSVWLYMALCMVGPLAIADNDGVFEKEDFRTVEWTELMPEADLDALMNPPGYLSEIEDGAEEDMLESLIRGAGDPAGDRYQQALTSTEVRPEFDGQLIRIPGFVVPLDFDERQRVTRFFLVPFFGACIHVPPPPPNQIIYAESAGGFDQASLYDAFWLSGRMSTTMTENDMAVSAYAMKVMAVEVYRE